MDSMTRRKRTALIVAGTLAVASVSIVLINKIDTATPQTPATTAQDGDAKRSANTVPAQIKQAPQYSQDVYMPPPSNAVGTSSSPAPARK